jgi:adenylate cyclase
MGAGELVRLVLGFSILPLLFHHFFAGRYVYSAFDVDRRYDVVLTAYFWFVPFWGWRQVTVLLVAWTHGCLGVHYWLRARSNYHKFAPVLLTAATLLSRCSDFGKARSKYSRSGNCTPTGFR